VAIIFRVPISMTVCTLSNLHFVLRITGFLIVIHHHQVHLNSTYFLCLGSLDFILQCCLYFTLNLAVICGCLQFYKEHIEEYFSSVLFNILDICVLVT
jgi:hypothetical protein